jgi:hypothetical protein
VFRDSHEQRRAAAWEFSFCFLEDEESQQGYLGKMLLAFKKAREIPRSACLRRAGSE